MGITIDSKQIVILQIQQSIKTSTVRLLSIC